MVISISIRIVYSCQCKHHFIRLKSLKLALLIASQ